MPNTPKPPFLIETPRLVIREWTLPDRPAFTALATDPEMMRYMTDGRPWSESEIDAYFARQADGINRFGFCMGALVERSSGLVIGLSGLQYLGTTGELEVGYWVARHLWGRGYASEAARGILDYGFERLGRERMLAITHAENRASRRVMEKLGMCFLKATTGQELGHRFPEIEVVLYGIERAEWPTETSPSALA